MIRINRKRQYINYFARYKIIIDGLYIKDINSGDSIMFDISEGYHSIYIQCDWCKSNKIEFLYNKDLEIEFNCQNALNGLLSIFGIFVSFFMKNKYLKLERIK